ncbi:MAG: hypothetical protein LBK47_10005 [Prevotellaceae bacterium]|nr:hypothetical protein [Prevotellaceae bacterium]
MGSEIFGVWIERAYRLNSGCAQGVQKKEIQHGSKSVVRCSSGKAPHIQATA